MLIAQEVLIVKVKGQDGRPISGVTVVGQEGRYKNKTDNLGEVYINRSNTERKFSFSIKGLVSLDTVLPMWLDTAIIEMQPLPFLIEEVIVSTGYQTLPKERATGSFVQLDEELLARRTSLNILDNIEGLATGLQFDNRSGSSRINIRGINSFSTGLGRPLIVVDNFPYEGNLDNIDPNEVESISILKDAAASSIWGAKAGNGVIVINLKKPEETKKVINVVANSLVSPKPNLFYYPRMNAIDFIEVEKFLYEKDFYKNALANSNNRMTIFSPVVLLLDQLDKGLEDPVKVETLINEYKSKDYRSEMLKHFYQLSLDNKVSASYSAGDKFFRTRASIAYQANRAIEKTSGSNMLNLRWSGDISASDRITLRPTMALTLSRSDRPAAFPFYPLNPGGGKNQMYPYAELFDSEGKALSVPNQFNYTYLEAQSDKGLMNWDYKPYDEIEASRRYGSSKHILLGMNIGYQIFDGLQAEIIYNYETHSGTSDVHHTLDAFYTRNLINRFTVIDNGDLKYNLPKGDILTHSLSNMLAHKARGQLTYEHSFGIHKVNALIGTELSDVSSIGSSNGIYGYNSEKQTSIPVDYVSVFPIYDGLSVSTNIPSFQSNNKALNRLVSTYLNGSYLLYDKYIASFSARKDASNVFGVNSNNRWNPLWSMGLSWRAGEENIFRNIDWLQNLKFSFTHGYGGSSGGIAGLLPIIEYMSRSIQWTSSLNRARVLTLPNADLKWEKVRQTNYAMAFSVFDGYLSADIEYYTKKSTDLLSPDNIDPTHGFSSLTKNIGVIRSKGVDINLKGNIGRDNWKWDGQFLFSWNKNKVEEYYGTVGSASTYVSNSGQSLRPITGESLYPVYAYRFDGLSPENGDPLGILDGESSADYRNLMRVEISDLAHFGTGLPPIYGSFRNGIGYKKVMFTFNIMFKAGHYFQKETIQYANLFNFWSTHSDFAKRWINKGDEKHTTVPSMVYPANTSRDQFYANSEANILKGDLIRLQDIQFSYDLSSSFKGYLSKIRVHANVHNLGILWKAADTDLDPDYSFTPRGTTYSFGINLNF